MYKIYAILNDDADVVYVGCTKSPLKRRVNAHLNTKTRLGKWIVASKYKAKIKVLHETDDVRKAKELETLELDFHKPILNQEKISRYSGIGPTGKQPWNKGVPNTTAKFGKDDGRSRRVIMMQLDGSIVKEFESASQASKELTGNRRKWQGNISNCCRGLQKTAYNYIFKYAS